MRKIDQLVDATYGHPRMNFLDTFQGYHQIALAHEDWEKTAFTYQWMMTRMFRDKIRHTIEVYIDDMVVKRKQETQHIDDLKGVFEVLYLNADKCAFEVRAGKFLTYLITNRGIEVNPKQIEAVKHLKPPSNP